MYKIILDIGKELELIGTTYDKIEAMMYVLKACELILHDREEVIIKKYERSHKLFLGDKFICEVLCLKV